ncbi:MAG: hypothetical protein O3B87_03925 [bacterium]|nr:hypothetical protein [bacterium]
MTIIFTKHAKIRFKERNFEEDVITDIILHPKIRCVDVILKSEVAISKKKYNNTLKYISVFYHYDNTDIIVHTAHPETKASIDNKIASKRYKLT